MVERPDATAQLHREVDRSEDRLDRRAIAALTGKSPIEINDMEIFKALVFERLRLRCGIVIEHGRLIHVAQLEAHALAVLEVDGRKKDHGVHLRKFSISFRPSACDFSG